MAQKRGKAFGATLNRLQSYGRQHAKNYLAGTNAGREYNPKRGSENKGFGGMVRNIPETVKKMVSNPGQIPKMVRGYKNGGKVKKTGLAYVHKGERVLNKKQTNKFESMKKKVFGIKKYGKN